MAKKLTADQQAYFYEKTYEFWNLHKWIEELGTSILKLQIKCKGDCRCSYPGPPYDYEVSPLDFFEQVQAELHKFDNDPSYCNFLEDMPQVALSICELCVFVSKAYAALEVGFFNNTSCEVYRLNKSGDFIPHKADVPDYFIYHISQLGDVLSQRVYMLLGYWHGIINSEIKEIKNPGGEAKKKQAEEKRALVDELLKKYIKAPNSYRRKEIRREVLDKIGGGTDRTFYNYLNRNTEKAGFSEKSS